jgi:hypothetical protein
MSEIKSYDPFSIGSPQVARTWPHAQHVCELALIHGGKFAASRTFGSYKGTEINENTLLLHKIVNESLKNMAKFKYLGTTVEKPNIYEAVTSILNPGNVC